MLMKSKLKKYNPSLKPRTIEPFMLMNGTTGQVFFSAQPVNQNLVIAGRHGRKINAERVIVVCDKNTGDPKAKVLTKVTLGEFIPRFIPVPDPDDYTNLDPLTLQKVEFMRNFGMVTLKAATLKDIVKYALDMAYNSTLDDHNHGQEHYRLPFEERLPPFEFSETNISETNRPKV